MMTRMRMRIWAAGLLFVYSINAVTAQLTITPPGEMIRGKDESIVFTCRSDSSGDNANLKWFKNSQTEITDRQGRIYVESTARSIKLYIKSIQSDDAAIYSCEGSNTRETVRLVVFEPIRFIYEEKQVKVIGTDATIACKVTGSPAPDVSWIFAGNKIETGGRYTVTDEGLHITGIRDPDDAGVYTCLAEVIDRGTLDERVIEVEIHTPPSITNEPGDAQGREDTDLTLICRATGKPAPQYIFYKIINGIEQQVISSERVRVDEVGGSLKFLPAKKEDDGNYRCKAYNDAGDQTSDGSVRVLLKPRLVSFPSVTVMEGGQATLTCQVTADPAALMKIIRDDTQTEYVNGENDNGRIDVSSADNQLQMVIKDVTRQDTGSYRCQAINDIGRVDRVTTLTVQYIPHFHEDHPTVFYVWAGKTRNMTCSAMGEPEPRVSWRRKDGLHVNSDDIFSVHNNGRHSHLVVNTPEDVHSVTSQYECHAENEVGNSKLEVTLSEATAPVNEPVSTIIDRRPTSIRLGVTPPTLNGFMPVIRYRVTVSDMDKPQEFDVGSDIIVRGLQPSTRYILSVAGENEVGVGPAGQVDAETEAESAPYTIQVTSEKESRYPHEYLVRWDQPEDGGKPITKYTFLLRQVKVDESDPSGVWSVTSALGEWKSTDVTMMAGETMMAWTLNGLLADMHYELKVKATNEIGTSPPSDSFIFHTAPVRHSPGSVRGTASAGVTPASLLTCILVLAVTWLAV